MKLKRSLAIVVFFSIGMFLAYQSTVRYLGWYEEDFIGKSPEQVWELAGADRERVCYKPDLDTWRFGLVVGDLLLAGVELDVYFGDPYRESRPIAVRAAVFARVLARYHKC